MILFCILALLIVAIILAITIKVGPITAWFVCVAGFLGIYFVVYY